MEELIKLNRILPKDCQLLVRTDLKTGGWFIHLFRHLHCDTKEEYKNETLYIKWCKTEELDNMLNDIENICHTVH